MCWLGQTDGIRIAPAGYARCKVYFDLVAAGATVTENVATVQLALFCIVHQPSLHRLDNWCVVASCKLRRHCLVASGLRVNFA